MSVLRGFTNLSLFLKDQQILAGRGMLIQIVKSFTVIAMEGVVILKHYVKITQGRNSEWVAPESMGSTVVLSASKSVEREVSESFFFALRALLTLERIRVVKWTNSAHHLPQYSLDWGETTLVGRCWVCGYTGNSVAS